MLAVAPLSAGATFGAYLVAFVALLAATIIAAHGRITWATLVAVGLAAYVYVAAWNALART